MMMMMMNINIVTIFTFIYNNFMLLVE